MQAAPVSWSAAIAPNPGALSVAASIAAGALSEMSGRSIAADVSRLNQIGIGELAVVGGDPEQQVIGIYLGVESDETSHILLALSEETAFRLAELMLEEALDRDELGDMAVSALAEVGNVIGACFLNVLADGAHLTLAPMPPVVVREMRGAILDSLGSSFALVGDSQLTVVETTFTCDGETIDIAVFLLGSANLSAIVGSVMGGRSGG